MTTPGGGPSVSASLAAQQSCRFFMPFATASPLPPRVAGSGGTGATAAAAAALVAATGPCCGCPKTIPGDCRRLRSWERHAGVASIAKPLLYEQIICVLEQHVDVPCKCTDTSCLRASFLRSGQPAVAAAAAAAAAANAAAKAAAAAEKTAKIAAEAAAKVDAAKKKHEVAVAAASAAETATEVTADAAATLGGSTTTEANETQAVVRSPMVAVALQATAATAATTAAMTSAETARAAVYGPVTEATAAVEAAAAELKDTEAAASEAADTSAVAAAEAATAEAAAADAAAAASEASAAEATATTNKRDILSAFLPSCGDSSEDCQPSNPYEAAAAAAAAKATSSAIEAEAAAAAAYAASTGRNAVTRCGGEVPASFEHLARRSVAELLLGPTVSHAIELDVHRTYPSVPFFQGHGKDALRRVLQAYALFDPEVGYVQGMNFVAGALMYHSSTTVQYAPQLQVKQFSLRSTGSVEGASYGPDGSKIGDGNIESRNDDVSRPSTTQTNTIMSRGNSITTTTTTNSSYCLQTQESRVFWLLVSLLYFYELRRLYLPSLPGVFEKCRILEDYLRVGNNDLLQHLDECGVSLPLLASDWLLTLFAYSVPLPALALVWTQFFEEGWVFIYKLAIARLRRMKHAIMRTYDIVEVVTIAKTSPPPARLGMVGDIFMSWLSSASATAAKSGVGGNAASRAFSNFSEAITRHQQNQYQGLGSCPTNDPNAASWGDAWSSIIDDVLEMTDDRRTFLDMELRLLQQQRAVPMGASYRQQLQQRQSRRYPQQSQGSQQEQQQLSDNSIVSTSVAASDSSSGVRSTSAVTDDSQLWKRVDYVSKRTLQSPVLSTQNPTDTNDDISPSINDHNIDTTITPTTVVVSGVSATSTSTDVSSSAATTSTTDETIHIDTIIDKNIKNENISNSINNDKDDDSCSNKRHSSGEFLFTDDNNNNSSNNIKDKVDRHCSPLLHVSETVLLLERHDPLQYQNDNHNNESEQLQHQFKQQQKRQLAAEIEDLCNEVYRQQKHMAKVAQQRQHLLHLVKQVLAKPAALPESLSHWMAAEVHD